MFSQVARRAVPLSSALSGSSLSALAAAASHTSSPTIAAAAVAFSAANASRRRTYATPVRHLPKGFRITPRPEWDQEKEGTFDKIGKYFMLLEMARGMYILMEQFFRPPYVAFAFASAFAFAFFFFFFFFLHLLLLLLPSAHTR